VKACRFLRRLVILLPLLAACSSAPVYTGRGIVCRAGDWSSGAAVVSGPVSGSERSMMDEIESWIGTPYVYGGTTKSGVDCSGFTQAVYLASGIEIPRTASQQAAASTEVSPGSLQFGDLLFFNTSGSGISHCGIFIGDGFFVHASSSRGVVRETIAKPYYSTRLVQAGRFLR
jgi:cell wall-associated NlpC family hydrolase